MWLHKDCTFKKIMDNANELFPEKAIDEEMVPEIVEIVETYKEFSINKGKEKYKGAVSEEHYYLCKACGQAWNIQENQNLFSIFDTEFEWR